MEPEIEAVPDEIEKISHLLKPGPAIDTVCLLQEQNEQAKLPSSWVFCCHYRSSPTSMLLMHLSADSVNTILLIYCRFTICLDLLGDVESIVVVCGKPFQDIRVSGDVFWNPFLVVDEYV